MITCVSRVIKEINPTAIKSLLLQNVLFYFPVLKVWFNSFLLFETARDTTSARQYITEFTPDTETHRDEKNDKKRFTTDVRTTLAAITYRSIVEDDETEFTTDIDATSTASTYVSVAAATEADPSSSQPHCMTDAGTDSTSTGLMRNSEKDFASTSETTPWTDVETSYTEDMSGGFTDDEMRGLTTGISYAGVTSAAPASDITAGVTGNTDVTLTPVTPTFITVHSETMFTAESETEDLTAVSKTLASTNKMADDDNVVFITGIAGGLGIVVLLTAIIAVCICRRRSRGEVFASFAVPARLDLLVSLTDSVSILLSLSLCLLNSLVISVSLTIFYCLHYIFLLFI